MATFTLTDLRNEVSKKYAPTVIENGADTYTLQNLIQLPKDKREEVTALVDKFESSSDDEEDEGLGLEGQMDTFRDIILAVETEGKGQELLDLLGDNPALLMELASAWMTGTQLGEAEHS